MGTSLDEEQGPGVNASLRAEADSALKLPRVAKPFQGTATVMQALEADLRRNVRGEVDRKSTR